MARMVMDRLIDDGRVTRGFLGVHLQLITPDLAKAFKLTDLNGALITDVESGTPAAKAGLQEGDVIIEFGSRKVTDIAHLRLMVSQTPPGTNVPLTILRGGKRQTLEVRLGELPTGEIAAAPREHPAESSPATLGVLEGVEVADITARLRQQLDIHSSVNGALVMSVRTDSSAYAAGLRANDVILGIDHQPVKNAGEAVDVARQIRGSQVLLHVWSREPRGSRYIVVNTGRR
jgi:serine protease Do